MFKDYEEKTGIPMQHWIDTNPNYNLIILICCNPNHHKVKSKDSIILYPDDELDMSRHESNSRKKCISECSFRYYIPGVGNLSDYELEYGIRKFKSKFNI